MRRLAAGLLASAVVAGCSCGGSDPSTPPPPTLALSAGTNPADSAIPAGSVAAVDAFQTAVSSGTASIASVTVTLANPAALANVFVNAAASCTGTTFGTLAAPGATATVTTAGLSAAGTQTFYVCVTAAVVAASTAVTGYAQTVAAAGYAVSGTSSGGTTVTVLRGASPVPAGTVRGVTTFGQNVPAEDALGTLFPGQANSWVIDRDFALALGYGLQYDPFALQLSVGNTRTPASTTPADVFDQLLSDWIDSASATTLLRAFPYDQGSSEVTFLTPVYAAADGLVTAVATTEIATGSVPVTAIAGTSAFLAGTADSRLVRTVTLVAGETYTLGWTDLLHPSPGRLAGGDVQPDGPRFQVVLRNPSTGAVLGDPLFVSTSATFLPEANRTATFSTAPGPIPAGPADLSFEFRSGASLSALPAFAAVDSVTLSGAGGPVASFTNGDFEAGLAGWSATGAQSQNVRSGARTLAFGPPQASLAITRTFYAPPTSQWARVVDVFENPHDAEVVTSVVYATQLAAGATAEWASAAGGKAIVGRDGDGFGRDVGIVFGSGAGIFDVASFTPDLAFVVHSIRVPARGKVGLVHFLVQLGQGATLDGAHPPGAPGTEAACAAIASGFRADATYQLDLEPGVLSLVGNM